MALSPHLVSKVEEEVLEMKSDLCIFTSTLCIQADCQTYLASAADGMNCDVLLVKTHLLMF